MYPKMTDFSLVMYAISSDRAGPGSVGALGKVLPPSPPKKKKKQEIFHKFTLI